MSFFWLYKSFFWCFGIESYIFCFPYILSFGFNYSVVKCLRRFFIALWLNYHDYSFITTQIASCSYFLSIIILWVVLSASAADCLARSRRFLARFITYVFIYAFVNIFTHIFSKRQKSISFLKYTSSRFNWITC